MDEILQAVKTLALAYASPYTEILNGAMPRSNGLAMYIGAGGNLSRHFDRGGIYDASFVLNGKHSDMRTVLQAMSHIHAELTQLAEYPKAENWQILSIESAALPNYIDKEPSTNQWLYGSILNVTFYIKECCKCLNLV
jgi:hypothetical protein